MDVSVIRSMSQFSLRSHFNVVTISTFVASIVGILLTYESSGKRCQLPVVEETILKSIESKGIHIHDDFFT